MSNAILQGGASGTGSVTLLAPNTNSTQTLTLPDNTGTLVGTASTGVITPPMLNGNQSGSAPIYGCRAWCNFDGTLTGTNAPRAGGNVTSVTRNAIGSYTITFTVPMQDANYAVTVGSLGTTNGTNSTQTILVAGFTAGAFGVIQQSTGLGTGGPIDTSLISIVVFR